MLTFNLIYSASITIEDGIIVNDLTYIILFSNVRLISRIFHEFVNLLHLTRNLIILESNLIVFVFFLYIYLCCMRVSNCISTILKKQVVIFLSYFSLLYVRCNNVKFDLLKAIYEFIVVIFVQFPLNENLNYNTSNKTEIDERRET